MNCPQCGKRIWSDYRSCKFCGLSLQPTASAVAEIPIGRNAELKGVGGWLLFFCILRTIFGPLSIYYPRNFGADSINILDLLQGIIGIVVGIHVWSISKSALSFLKIYFTAALLVLAVRLFVSLATLLGGQNAVATGIELMVCLIRVGITIAWIGYFRYSERVKSTFGSNLVFPF